VVLVLIGAVVSSAAPQPLQTQEPDSTRAVRQPTHLMKTRDGSLFIGRLIVESADSVGFLTIGGPVVVARTSIEELKAIPTDALHEGAYWTPDPNHTRLFFAPTGRMLAKGDGYFSDTYLLLLNFVGGMTPRFTMGGGFSIIPSSEPHNNIVYVTPKFGLVQQERFSLAVGAVGAFAGFEDIDPAWRTFGILYGVGTYGSPAASVTLGGGMAYNGNGLAERPIFMLGGSARAGRRATLITENYLFPSASSRGLVSYGVRFFGDKLSVDLAFANLAGSGSEIVFPGIPYVAMALKF
jgi:hypothetical protein